MSLKQFARKIVPFHLRLELLRLRRMPMWAIERSTIANQLASASDLHLYSFNLARHTSPLKREVGDYEPRFQLGKERNVALASSLLNGLVVQPNQIFSYYHIVGRPSRLRGFKPGLELHSAKSSHGVGGGCCQIANMLYVLALNAGMRIVERHRHALDLFPDSDRKVPFGCGATIFYNYADFRFENPLQNPVLLSLNIEDGVLVGELKTSLDPRFRVEVYEVDHRYFQEGGEWFRENRIRRKFLRANGSLILDREEAHNRGRILYDPPKTSC